MAGIVKKIEIGVDYLDTLSDVELVTLIASYFLVKTNADSEILLKGHEELFELSKEVLQKGLLERCL